MVINTASELSAQANLWMARFISGTLEPGDPLKVIDKNSGIISTIQEAKIEEHYEGQGDGEDGEQVLIGRTLWLVVEED